MKDRHCIFLSSIFFAFSFGVTTASAEEFFSVLPSELALDLGPGEMTVEKVSLTVHPFCVRAYEVDVVASDPNVKAKNLTGVLINGCGGDTSNFEVGIEGAGEPQGFDLQFVDAAFGGILASIPVNIGEGKSRGEPLLGLLTRSIGISFQVSSNGCTSKPDFRVDVFESIPLQLNLVRTKADPCDAFVPLGTRIQFSYRELGLRPGEEFQVRNPLAVVEVPIRRSR